MLGLAERRLGSYGDKDTVIITSPRFSATVGRHTPQTLMRDVFEQSVEHVRRDDGFGVGAYIVMPKPVHWLAAEFWLHSPSQCGR